jgi:hypothetical protein
VLLDVTRSVDDSRLRIGFGANRADWYREGANLLVSKQDETSGFWKGATIVEDHAQVGTSFALLFLSHRKATEE